MAVASVIVPAEGNVNVDNPFQKGLGLSLDSPPRVSD